MPTNPKFSVIAVDYEDHVPRDAMRLGLKSLADQTFKDFELIIWHDGPKRVPYHDEVPLAEMGLDPVLINSDVRINDWGHSGRDAGMRIAKGDYFIQFNIDNIFFSDAFETLAEALDEQEEKIIIFPVHHWKAAGGAVFAGWPPVLNGIDCMQLVAHRDIWAEVNYWWSKDYASDGIIYENMCQRFPSRHLDKCLGHNY